MSDTFERRWCGELEVRDIGETPKIFGHAAVFNSRSEVIDGRFREVILPGAFQGVLAGQKDIVALVAHDSSKVLGRRSAGTLELREDDRGLAVVIDPPDTAFGRDVVTQVRRGDFKGMSFRFLPAKGGQQWTRENGESLRTLSEIAVMPEVSLEAFPAYQATTASIRSLDEFERAQSEEDVAAWAEHERRKLDLEAESV